MRGKDTGSTINNRHQRITPAHAGKSRPVSLKLLGGQDHPRACGEKSLTFNSAAISAGSPPRMRGEAQKAEEADERFGITPAHAGRSVSRMPAWPCCKDHPRACGEKCLGQPHDHGHLGITPAHAGRSSCRPAGCPGCRDHPRACGEKSVRRRGTFL